MRNSKGMVIHESRRVAVILTYNSNNSKTGDMAQVAILNKNVNPIEATKTGEDVHVCFNCQHKPSNNGTCYVNVGQAPNQIYKAYKKGNYQTYDAKMLNWRLKHSRVRLGSYGEPVLIPLETIETLRKQCKGVTGYTHQWKDVKYKSHMKYLMASVDNVEEYKQATAMGYRTYRVSVDGMCEDGEIPCPNTKTNVQCRDCMLCNGDTSGGKNINIKVHGYAYKVINFTRSL